MDDTAPIKNESIIKQRNQQLADLGSSRRFEIVNAGDDRDNTRFRRYTQRDLESLRDSVQDVETSQYRKENQAHLAKWGDFHQIAGDVEEEMAPMDGQSHRARLHFEMRDKGAIISVQIPPNHMGPASARRPPRGGHSAMSFLDPALDDSRLPQRTTSHPKAPTIVKTDLKKKGSAKSLLDPALNPPHLSPRTTAGWKGKCSAMKTQRRTVRLPSNDYVDLVDPSIWLEQVRHSSQSSTPKKLENTPQTTTFESSFAVSNPSSATMQPTINLEAQILKSNLPQPQQQNNPIFHSRGSSQPSEGEDFLIALNISPVKVRQATVTEKSDDVKKVEEHMPKNADNCLRWLDEIGRINDALALEIVDISQKKALVERRQMLLDRLNHHLSKTDSQSKPKKPERLAVSTTTGSLLQQSVRAKPFVPLKNPHSLGASLHSPAGLGASRYAQSKNIKHDKIDGHKEGADHPADYWQKTLPRNVVSRQINKEVPPQITPMATPIIQNKNPSTPKATISLYKSRYAC